MNKGFKFRLEAVRKLRSFEEDKCKIELGLIIKKINDLKRRINSCEESIDQAYSSQGEALKAQAQASDVAFYPFYIEGRRADVVAMKNEVRKLNEEKNQKTQELAVLRSKTKVLEKLKAKRKAEYSKKLTKKNDEQLEEEVQRWLRRKEVS